MISLSVIVINCVFSHAFGFLKTLLFYSILFFPLRISFNGFSFSVAVIGLYKLDWHGPNKLHRTPYNKMKRIAVIYTNGHQQPNLSIQPTSDIPQGECMHVKFVHFFMASFN